MLHVVIVTIYFMAILGSLNIPSKCQCRKCDGIEQKEHNDNQSFS